MVCPVKTETEYDYNAENGVSCYSSNSSPASTSFSPANFQKRGMPFFSGVITVSITIRRYYTPALGRWISRDPIEEKGGGNLYVYCFNAVFKFNDYIGREAYPPSWYNQYDNPTKAARRRCEKAHAKSEGTEYCGNVCRDNCTNKYFTTEAKGNTVVITIIENGEEISFSRQQCRPSDAPCPKCSYSVATWHTHPIGTVPPGIEDADRFSKTDLDGDNATNQDGYLCDSDGTFLQHIPTGIIGRTGQIINRGKLK